MELEPDIGHLAEHAETPRAKVVISKLDKVEALLKAREETL